MAWSGFGHAAPLRMHRSCRRMLARRRPPGWSVGPSGRRRAVLVEAEPAVHRRIRDRPCPVLDAELVQDGGDVVLDGLAAEAQAVGDLLVAHAGRDEAQDLHLAVREGVLGLAV